MTPRGKLVFGTLFLVIVLIIVAILGRKNSPESTTVQAPNATVTIGFVGPLTGNNAAIGTNAKAAVEVAVDDINKTGGVGGKQLSVAYEDGACNGADGTLAANTLINTNKVPAIIGGACSSETSAIASIAQQSKTVVLSYCSIDPTTPETGNYVFRDYPSDTLQGSFIAGYLYNTLNSKKAALLYIQNDYGTRMKNAFAPSFKKLGGTIVEEESFDPNASDLKTELTKIKSANPDVIYFIADTNETVIGLKESAALGIKAHLFGTSTWSDPQIYTSAGKAAEGIMYPTPVTPTSDSFVMAMKTKTGNSQILSCSASAYDAVHIIANIINKVGTDGTAIKNELLATDYTQGVSAPEIKFDQNGIMTNANYVVQVVKNGISQEKK